MLSTPAAPTTRSSARSGPRCSGKNGYHTAQIGKWHTGTDAGFGRDWDYQIVWNRPKHPDNAGAYYEKQILAFNGVEREVRTATRRTTTRSGRSSTSRGEIRDKDKPWFLWLCYGSVHGPSKPAARHKGTVQGREGARTGGPPRARPGKPGYLNNTPAWRKDKDGRVIAGKTARRWATTPAEGAEFADWVRQVNECVPAVDESVGELVMAALKETGQLENTLVIYTADQGFAMGEHGLRMKIAPYDANYRSPLIVVDARAWSRPGKSCKQAPNAPGPGRHVLRDSPG